MIRTGIADMPLHCGRAPLWLVQRMAKLGGNILIILSQEFGPAEVLRRLSQPFWFQALGCILGFDWHSSGVTTTLTYALKQGIKNREKEVGIFICGGKGKYSLRTPSEITNGCQKIDKDPKPLIYASRMSAKVDTSALQDGYTLYHHSFFFTSDGQWCVIQQGMNPKTRLARRYHWLGEKIKRFIDEPHEAICCDKTSKVLNMTAKESESNRSQIVRLANMAPGFWEKEIKYINLPHRHYITTKDISIQYLKKILLKTYETQPKEFEEFLSIAGVGPKTVRALALLAELIYGSPLCFKDPARYSFAHGGKDGHPYPVDLKTYDKTIEVIEKGINKTKIEPKERYLALKRLERYINLIS
jgi:hypothetical protein